MKALVGLVVGVVLAACGGAGGGKGDAGQDPVDAGRDAGQDSVLDAGSDAGQLPVDAGTPDAGATCAWGRPCAVSYVDSAPYPVKVDHHSSMVHTSAAGTYLYVFGGVRAEFSDVKEDYAAVRRAKVLDSGALGAWEDLAPLPRTLSFHSMAWNEQRVYLVGGITITGAHKAAPNTNVLVGDFDADGKLTWRNGGALQRVAVHPTAVILGDTLWCLGGTDGQVPVADTNVATLGADGLNGNFFDGPPLPTPRSHHMSFVGHGKIFILGGFDAANNPLEVILRSELDKDGKVTGWDPASLMLDAPWTAGVAFRDDAIIVVGGGQGGPGYEEYVARVRRAGLYPDDTIGVFTDVGTLPVARSHVHQAPLYGDHLYSVGGRLQPSLDTMDRVFVGTMSSKVQ
ncbi:MAG: hypothetical protein K1X89_30150 [Myxococcaceae bacterium]|nr:hypothetical protein [Myxococcaceae bacterium]